MQRMNRVEDRTIEKDNFGRVETVDSHVDETLLMQIDVG
jgi:hypothetical protein